MIIFAYYSRVIFISFYLVALHLSWMYVQRCACVSRTLYVRARAIVWVVYCSIRRQAKPHVTVLGLCVYTCILCIAYAFVRCCIFGEFSVLTLCLCLCRRECVYVCVLCAFLVVWSVFVYRTEYGIRFDIYMHIGTATQRNTMLPLVLLHVLLSYCLTFMYRIPCVPNLFVYACTYRF